MTREEAIEMLKALNMMMHSPDGEPISDVCDALGMAIVALLAENSNQETQKSNGDLIKRADAIDAICKVWCYTTYGMCPHDDGYCKGCDEIEAIDALPSAEAVHIETYRELYEKYVELKHASAEAKGDLISRQDAVTTIKRYKHRLQGKGQTYGFLLEEFEHQIPSAEAVSREVYEETDGVVTIEKQNAKEVGEIKHIVIRSPNYTRYFYNESMPLPAEAVYKPDYSYEADMVRRLREYEQGYRQEQAEDVTNGRLIDADALSEKLCETTIFIKDGEVFQRMINDAPTASADAVQRWIPCSERLPSEGEVVLASWSCLWKGAIVLARRYEGKWEWAYEHGADYWQPTELEEYWPEAWMPLPEPYKQKTERRG